MNKIKVLFFATLRDRVGAKSIDVEIPAGTTVGGLKDQLSGAYPELQKSLETVVVSINREFAFDEDMILESCEVAMFPPVSGG